MALPEVVGGLGGLDEGEGGDPGVVGVDDDVGSLVVGDPSVGPGAGDPLGEPLGVASATGAGVGRGPSSLHLQRSI